METSKLYKQLGKRIGIVQGLKTQRGIIARRIIEHIDKLELVNFKLQLKRIEL